MLTSPVNVTIATNGAALKANTPASDHNSARREPPLLPVVQAQPAETVIEPELPSSSPLTNLNAMTATVGNRTVLQELTLNVATMLRIARRADENLTSLFLRIIATIEAMPPAERLQVEIRAGLKPLKITLGDLAMALRKPGGQEAAHLTALAEAPASMPGRTAANAATTTYLEEGTDSGHTEEKLAMRAAARHSAAGQSVFSAESKIRPADAQPVDAKVLQNHLKTMFEPGEAKQAVQQPAQQANQQAAPLTEATGDADHAGAQSLVEPEQPPSANDGVSVGDMHTKPTPRDVAPPNLRQPMPPAPANAGENVTFSSASLNLDQSTVEKIRSVAQAITSLAETFRADQERPASEKGEDRRMQTMLTLKGLAEVVTAIPAKAAELLAIVIAEAAAPLPEATDESSQAVGRPLQEAFDNEKVSEFAAASDEIMTENAVALDAAEEMPIEVRAEGEPSVAEHVETQTDAATMEVHQTAPDVEGLPPARPDVTQHAVPFAYAQVQPAREEMIEAVEEEDDREETDEDGDNDSDEDGEPRRPRDEYDAIHDPVPEQEEAIVINRDSSNADRAFALYQRMAGF